MVAIVIDREYTFRDCDLKVFLCRHCYLNSLGVFFLKDDRLCCERATVKRIRKFQVSVSFTVLVSVSLLCFVNGFTTLFTITVTDSQFCSQYHSEFKC